MGPDEFPTREELGLMLKLTQARINRLARSQIELVNLLTERGIISTPDLDAAAERLQNSPEQQRVDECFERVRQFAEVHKIARPYLDPPEE
jgi:hypothetical protein